MKKIVALTCATLLATVLHAQDINGVVLDANGQPMQGAAVYWADTNVGASTNPEGEFRLHRVKGYDNLVATFLGYDNDTVKVDASMPRPERLEIRRRKAQ